MFCVQDYVQIAEAVLSTLCQCMTRESCCNYLINLNCEDLLVSMSKSLIIQVGNNAKMILSFLSRYLPQDYQRSFKLSMKEIAVLLQSLNIVIDHGVPEGELFFSALEMMQSLIFFVQFEPNREVMAYSDVYKPIAHLLQSSDAVEQRVACELLWKLVTKPVSEETIVITTKKRNVSDSIENLEPFEFMAEPSIQLFILQNYPEILKILSTLAQMVGPQTPFYSCTLLVLDNESAATIGKGRLACNVATSISINLILLCSTDILKTLYFAEGCYMCGKYAECFKIVSWVYQISDDDRVKKKALDLKGKALYYVFVAEKRSLKSRASKAATISCYNKAREAINLLGLSIDNGADIVAEKLLDQVHINYIRKTRSPDLIRCLLCRNKDELRASHVWPNSVLKHLLKCMSSPQQQVFSVPWKDYGSLQTSKRMTFPMLCDDCEQLLSRTCERKFKVEFFSKLYDPDNVYAKLAKPQTIEYGDYLYRFCLSIIFRGLPLVDSDISEKGNADDIYKLFTTCRKLLLNENNVDLVNKPSIALFLSPTALPEGVHSVPMIDRILHSAGMIILSPWSLDECTLYHGKASFLLASLGVLNLVVSLDPKNPLLLPATNLIRPEGGTLMFPEDSKRFFNMPLGLWKLLEYAAGSYSQQVFHLPQKLAKTQDWAKQEVSDLQSMLLGFKPDENTSKEILNFLPDNFDVGHVFRLSGKSLKLPFGHRILLHTYENMGSWKTSLFLAVSSDSSADSQFSHNTPYAIVIQSVPGYIVSLGYFISQSNAATTSGLVSSRDKPMLPSIEAKYKTKVIADKLLSKVLQQRGFSSMEMLLFWLERV